MSELPEPTAAAFPEDEDGQDVQLELLDPFEGDGLDFGTWVEQMPKDDQYRSLWRWS
jgi:hypothetical protein